MKRSDVIDNKNIQAGDVVIGLESYGKATYETGNPETLNPNPEPRTPNP
jgi:hypothetical protein